MNAAALRKMLEMGLTLEQAVELAEAWEEGASLPVTMSAGAARTRKWREKKAAEKEQASPRDVTVTHHGDAPTRSARVVTPFSSSLRSEEVGGGGGERASAPADDWPEGKATDHVRLLVAQVASPRLDPSKSPGLITTAGRLVAWRKEGASWEHDVVPVVTAVCAKQRSPVSTWKFFDQAIGRSIADNRAALEIPDARVVRLHATGPPSFADTFAAERAEARRKALEDG
jgi:hypothetical protein